MNIELGFFLFFVTLYLILMLVGAGKSDGGISWGDWKSSRIEEKESPLRQWAHFVIVVGILMYSFLDMKQISCIVMGIGVLIFINESLKS